VEGVRSFGLRLWASSFFLCIINLSEALNIHASQGFLMLRVYL